MHASVNWSLSFLNQPLLPHAEDPLNKCVGGNRGNTWGRGGGVCPLVPFSRSKELGHRGGGREMRWAGDLSECPLHPATLSCPSQLEDLETRVVEDSLVSQRHPPPTASSQNVKDLQLDLRNLPRGPSLNLSPSSRPEPPPQSLQHSESTGLAAPPGGGAPRRP